MTGPGRIYLLWEHDEGGPEGLVATDERILVAQLLEVRLSRYRPDPSWDRGERLRTFLMDNDRARAIAQSALTADAPGIYPLFSGWGGTHLQIVDLEPR